MVNVIIWLAATIAMFWSGNVPGPLAGGAAAAVVVTVVRVIRQQPRLDALVAEYCERFGEPPPGFSALGTRVGGAVGQAAGDYATGAIVGAALDIWQEHQVEKRMSGEQCGLYRQIRALKAWTPWMGLYSVGCGLAVSAGAAWVWSIALR